jgi:hypothetical protein
MLERKSILDQIEITREGALQVRIGLLIVDGDKELSCKWHRFCLPADADIPADALAQQMAAVNTHLAAMGEAQVGQRCIDRMAAAHNLCKLFVAENVAVADAQAKGE